MCKSYFLRYVCGHSTPHNFGRGHKIPIVQCKPCRRARKSKCQMESIYTNKDHDCEDCQRKEWLQIQGRIRGAERMRNMSDTALKHYRPSEPWLAGPRLPHQVPTIKLHPVPRLAQEMASTQQKEMLTPPKRYFKEKYRKVQRQVQGERMSNVVLELEGVVESFLSPEAATPAAAADVELEAKRMVPIRGGPPIPGFTSSPSRNKEHERKAKRENSRLQVQSPIGKKLDKKLDNSTLEASHRKTK